MDDLILIKPTIELEQALLIYQSEFFDSPNGIAGSSSLADFKDISEWIHHLFLYENKETMPNKSFVPGNQYVLLRTTDNKIVGLSHLRTELNDYLFNYAGHIGYSIAPSERQKGYGKFILKQTLPLTKEFEIDKVLVTCDDDNIGSAKIIEANFGILENKQIDPTTHKLVRRYWITP